ncbi:hypothetical protein [Glycomyces halotolerans]
MQNPVQRCAALGAAAVIALTGCADDAGEGGETVAEDHAALVELSERLTKAEEHAYTAEYLVEGTGESVTVAVDPEAGDAVVVVGGQTEFWAGDGDPAELRTWLSVELVGVLPSSGEVSSWLTAASEDPSAATEFSDTTLAGELADCVNVSGASSSRVGAYKVCVTTVGVIASVTAEVGELSYTAKLVNYHDGVDAAWMRDLMSNGRHTNG